MGRNEKKKKKLWGAINYSMKQEIKTAREGIKGRQDITRVGRKEDYFCS